MLWNSWGRVISMALSSKAHGLSVGHHHSPLLAQLATATLPSRAAQASEEGTSFFDGTSFCWGLTHSVLAFHGSNALMGFQPDQEALTADSEVRVLK